MVHDSDNFFMHTVDLDSPTTKEGGGLPPLDFEQPGIQMVLGGVRSPLGTISLKNDEVSCGFVSEQEYKALGLGKETSSPKRSPSLQHSPSLRLKKTRSEIWHPRVDDE